MQLSLEDRRLIGDSIGRLCRDLSARHFPRPEEPCGDAAFQAAQRQLEEQGVLNTTEAPGCGLWEDCSDPGNLALTLDSLATIATANAALALSLHRAALARQLLDRLDYRPEPATDVARLALCLHGRHGIGRGELAHWWQGRAPDLALLSDVFDAQRPRLALMQSNTGGVLCPVFEAGTLQWWLCAPPALAAEAHGLDELRTGQVACAGGQPLPLARAAAPALAREIWHCEWLGLLAIQHGVVRQAFDKARDHAALRFQGGQLIDRHPAVQVLLAGIRAALADGAGFLRAQALDATGFGALLLARNRLQDNLAEAASAAMQIHGGTGYMQDSGLEKCFRDVNQLRYQSGGPLDMQLLAAHWEDAS